MEKARPGSIVLLHTPDLRYVSEATFDVTGLRRRNSAGKRTTGATTSRSSAVVSRFSEGARGRDAALLGGANDRRRRRRAS